MGKIEWGNFGKTAQGLLTAAVGVGLLYLLPVVPTVGYTVITTGLGQAGLVGIPHKVLKAIQAGPVVKKWR